MELAAPHRDGWLGIPLRFTAGQPIACVPALDDTETRRLDAAHTRLCAAYRALRDDQPTRLPTARTP